MMTMMMKYGKSQSYNNNFVALIVNTVLSYSREIARQLLKSICAG